MQPFGCMNNRQPNGCMSTAGASLRYGGPRLLAAGTAWFGDTVTLRWTLIHVIEDTARHAGHADIVPELIDGMTGDHRRDEHPRGGIPWGCWCWGDKR